MPNLHKIGNQERHMNNLGSLDSWRGVHHKFVFLQSPPGLVFSLMMRNGAGSHQCPLLFKAPCSRERLVGPPACILFKNSTTQIFLLENEFMFGWWTLESVKDNEKVVGKLLAMLRILKVMFALKENNN